MVENCRICELRKPRRYCPGVRGDICPQCCGNEREQTVECPFECPYLQESRIRERQPILNPDTFPNQDVRITDRFLMEHERLLIFLSAVLTQAAMTTEGAIDFDVREALQGLIRTYRTLQSGLVYETRPANPIAGRIYDEVQRNLAELREKVQAIRDAEVLGILVFLERLELQHNNDRRKGKAFIDFLRKQFPPPEAPAASLIQT